MLCNHDNQHEHGIVNTLYENEGAIIFSNIKKGGIIVGEGLMLKIRYLHAVNSLSNSTSHY